MQVKNLTQLSKLISEMADKGAMKEERNLHSGRPPEIS